jgi:hypothetical protein
MKHTVSLILPNLNHIGKRNLRLNDDIRTSDLASNFRPPSVTGEIVPKRSAGKKKEAAAGASA